MAIDYLMKNNLNAVTVMEKYETPWINRSDWTNVHLGSDTTKDTDSNVTHSLNAPLRDLMITVLISTDGTDANSFLVGGTDVTSASSEYYMGLNIFQVDNNNVKIQTGATGLSALNDSGNFYILDTEDWYYKIVILKPVTGQIVCTSAQLNHYDTGWINRSDWSLVLMGSNTTKNTDSYVNHNLNAPLSDLIVKVLISTDGTDENSFEIKDGIYEVSGTYWGLQRDEVDNNNIKVKTSNAGFIYISDSGTTSGIGTNDWYYKIMVYKLISR
jgi:hypothetical protein